MIATTKKLLRDLKEYPDGGISFGINHPSSDTETTHETMNELFTTGSPYANTDSSYADETGSWTVNNGTATHDDRWTSSSKVV